MLNDQPLEFFWGVYVHYRSKVWNNYVFVSYAHQAGICLIKNTQNCNIVKNYSNFYMTFLLQYIAVIKAEF